MGNNDLMEQIAGVVLDGITRFGDEENIQRIIEELKERVGDRRSNSILTKVVEDIDDDRIKEMVKSSIYRDHNWFYQQVIPDTLDLLMGSCSGEKTALQEQKEYLGQLAGVDDSRKWTSSKTLNGKVIKDICELCEDISKQYKKGAINVSAPGSDEKIDVAKMLSAAVDTKVNSIISEIRKRETSCYLPAPSTKSTAILRDTLRISLYEAAKEDVRKGSKAAMRTSFEKDRADYLAALSPSTIRNNASKVRFYEFVKKWNNYYGRNQWERSGNYDEVPDLATAMDTERKNADRHALSKVRENIEALVNKTVQLKVHSSLGDLLNRISEGYSTEENEDANEEEVLQVKPEEVAKPVKKTKYICASKQKVVEFVFGGYLKDLAKGGDAQEAKPFSNYQLSYEDVKEKSLDSIIKGHRQRVTNSLKQYRHNVKKIVEVFGQLGTFDPTSMLQQHYLQPFTEAVAGCHSTLHTGRSGFTELRKKMSGRGYYNWNWYQYAQDDISMRLFEPIEETDRAINAAINREDVKSILSKLSKEEGMTVTQIIFIEAYVDIEKQSLDDFSQRVKQTDEWWNLYHDESLIAECAKKGDNAHYNYHLWRGRKLSSKESGDLNKHWIAAENWRMKEIAPGYREQLKQTCQEEVDRVCANILAGCKRGAKK